MDMLAARSFRVLLAVALAANCCLPCYTLAYADESDDRGRYEQLREDQPECAGDGQADQGPDFQGVLRYEAPEEASSGSELSHAAGVGRICPSGHVLVEASYSLADTLIRFSSVRAYADESQEVENVPQEEQEEIAGDSTGGLEFSPAVGESNADAADGGAAAEGHGSDYGASEEAGGDSSASDGGLDDSGNFFERVLGSLEDITYLLGEIADYYRSGFVPGAGDGIVALAGYGGSLTGGFGGAFSGGSGSGKSANLTDVADSFTAAWGYGYGGTAVFYKNSPAGWLNYLYNGSWYTGSLAGSSSSGTYRPTQLLAYIYSNTYNFSTRMNELLIAFRNAWGYGYGGTAVITKNSPASWLQYIYQASSYSGSLAGSDGSGTYTLGQLLAWSYSNSYHSAQRLASIVSSSDLISSRLVYSGALAGSVTSGTYTVAQLLSWIYSNGYHSAQRLSSLNSISDVISSRLLYSGTIAGTDVSGTYSVAQLLSWLYSNSYNTGNRVSEIVAVLDSVTQGSEGGRVSLYNIGNAVETIKNETRDLDNLLQSVYDRLSVLDALGVRLANIALTADDINKGVNSSVQWSEVLHGDLSLLRHGAADLLPGYADWTLWDFLQGIYFDLGQIVDLLKGLQQTLTAWGNRWDSQDLYLMEWAKRWDSLDKSPADLSETNKLLGRLTADVASIRDKYVLEDALSSILDVLVGDLQTPQTQAALSSIQDVMSTRFPFCIPSLVNVVLFGSVLADAVPPVWEFDIVGSPLVVDFSDYVQFAEVCRWTVLVLFTASLLLNTRRFIYGMGGGVE